MISLTDKLQPVRSLAIDTETKHLRWWDKSQGRPVFLLQWSDEESDDCCTPDDEEGMARFHAAVSSVKRLLFANAGFDIGMMRTSGIMDVLQSGHEVVDVQTLARIVLPERGFKGYKLKSLGADLLGADAKDEQKHLKELCSEIGLRTLNAEGAFKALWDAYPREVEAYGMKDTRLTFDLYELLCKRASPQDLAIAQFEVDVEDVLRRAEEWGVLVDKTALAALRAQYEATVEDMHSSLLQYLSPAALGDDGNAASQDELRQGLLDAGIPLYRMTDKSKKLATNKDALSEFEDDYPVINLLFGWRAAKKLLATYIGALELADPRCHTSFNSVGARTSRMTARSPNMQNLPRAKKDSAGVRSAIVPAEDNALLVCDYDSVEVAGLAHYLKRAVHEPGLADALDAGLDPHARTAARVYGSKAPAKGGPPSPLHGAELYDYYCKKAPGEPYRGTAKETTFSCVPLESEILTRRGWLRHDEVRVGDETPGYIEGAAQWTRITHVHHPGEREVITWGHSHFQMRCTPEHRWIVDRPRRSSRATRAKPYADLRTEDRLVVSAPAEGGRSDVTPDEAAIVAWILTDGSLRIAPLTGAASQGRGGWRQQHSAEVSQKKEPQRADLRELLERSGFLLRETPAPDGCTTFALRSDKVRELWRRAGLGDRLTTDLIPFVLGLRADSRSAFVAAGIAAEGCARPGGMTWSQNVGPILEGFALAFHLDGYRVHRRPQRRDTRANFDHVVLALTRPTVTMQHKKAREIAVTTEPVWCVTTELGTWTMRQGGDAMLTGNSMYGIGYKKLARRLGVTEQEAKAIKNEVLNSIDGYWDLVDALRLKMAKTGYLRTVLGRRLDVPPGKTHIFLNSIVQGSCAEVMKLGMLAAVPRLAEWDYRIILVVHDELVSEGPARYAAEAKIACIEAMESVSHNLLTVGLKATGDWTTKSYGDAK